MDSAYKSAQEECRHGQARGAKNKKKNKRGKRRAKRQPSDTSARQKASNELSHAHSQIALFRNRRGSARPGERVGVTARITFSVRVEGDQAASGGVQCGRRARFIGLSPLSQFRERHFDPRMAIGRDLLSEELPRPLKVWYHNGEENWDELCRRLDAEWCPQKRGGVGPQLAYNTGKGIRLRIKQGLDGCIDYPKCF
jgi:hypothetical protein